MLALASASYSAEFGVVIASTLSRSLFADGDHSTRHLSRTPRAEPLPSSFCSAINRAVEDATLLGLGPVTGRCRDVGPWYTRAGQPTVKGVERCRRCGDRRPQSASRKERDRGSLGTDLGCAGGARHRAHHGAGASPQAAPGPSPFGSHVVVFVVVNSFLVAAWAITGTAYFWPAWVLAAWGVGLVLHAWETFVDRPVTEADVEAELRRRRR